MGRSADVRTPLAIVSFSKDLFTARANDSGVEKHGCTLLFSKSDNIAVLKEAAMTAAKDEWGDKAEGMFKAGLIKSPFLDGDGPQGLNKKTMERHAGYEGSTFIRCSSGADYKPKVFDGKRNPVYDADEVPSGSKVYAVVNAYTWDNDKNGKGISFGISLVQVVKKASGDEVLGGSGGPSADAFFEVIEDSGDVPSSVKSAEDMFG